MKIILADSIFKRFKGLMCIKEFEDCLLFTNLKDSSIHTMFMRFEIDIYFIDVSQSAKLQINIEKPNHLLLSWYNIM